MATYDIVIWPHAALSTPAEPVEAFDEELHAFLDDMAETMYAAGGVGLAANQIDVLRRVTVIDTAGPDDPSELLELINPRVIESDGEIVWEEGCLSFPQLYEKIVRPGEVTVRYQDRQGETHEIEAEGLLAVALQHEIDHLDGVVFLERMPLLTRKMAEKRWAKLAAEQGFPQP